ncbi:hypothetical protein Msub_12236 [Marinobacter subterrani]|uniref:Uncharacterized protein n=1 Tax=Marinobacter subterrani TaxID=1658765 RepID=A0A0J7JD51_9GAMM|nr:hypothetical protein [Marinobacter subterrani]KMQ76027.1 hypothetical protein Msub_12236 [Marinobacter subterrani]
MSDKFFFKGRQDARQHHTAYGGFQTNASQKSGSNQDITFLRNEP